jgi:predicted lipoprotein with Yx(FWY)xxD motif
VVLRADVKRRRATLLALLALGLVSAGCGSHEEEGGPGADGTAAPTARTSTGTGDATVTTETTTTPSTEELARRPEGEEGLRVPARRARITVEDSEFGSVLFDANGQVVYVFENDRPNRSNCTSADCVRAWPPVLTREEPTAGEGVDASLVGTIRRSDGALQVTYDGRPLYFYEHEAPGEIRCHNVDLHGGLWWVVTPSGQPAD